MLHAETVTKIKCICKTTWKNIGSNWKKKNEAHINDETKYTYKLLFLF